MRSRSSAAIVLASCISANVPSCIRAPPEALTMTSGIRSSSAASAARATFSPTTAPIEPPMNPKSMTTIATGVPSIRPVPQTAASRRPVASCAAATRSGYAFWSTKPSGSSDTSPASRSAQVPSSRSCARRTVAGSRKWWPHDGQTCIAFSSCLLNSCSSHDGQRVHMFSGPAASRRERKVGNFIGIRPVPRGRRRAAAAAVEAVAMTSAETPAAARRARAARAARAMARLLDRPAAGRGRGARRATRRTRRRPARSPRT